MNISKNSRYQNTEERIEQALLRLLRRRKLDDVYVKDICLEAEINRSSFYSHYLDINDLMMKYEDKIAKNMSDIFCKTDQLSDQTFLKMFEFIKENQIFYRAYLRAGQNTILERNMFKVFKAPLINFGLKYGLTYSDSEVEYHMCFFAAGLKAICEKWLKNNCLESPQEMANLIMKEYRYRISTWTGEM